MTVRAIAAKHLPAPLRDLLRRAEAAWRTPPAPVPETLSGSEAAAGAHWDRMLLRPKPAGIAWWDDPTTIRHLNRIVCGEPICGLHAGFHRRIGQWIAAAGRGPARALSVGSGAGSKEADLLLSGAVAAIDCYEVSGAAVETGRQLAAGHGLGGRMRFHHANAFAAAVPEGAFDLVYWNNALHHMADTAAAMAWSRTRLRQGGLFAIDDYVGANRFQHSDRLMGWTNRALAALPARLFRSDPDPARHLSRERLRVSAEAVAAEDPSEAPDSAAILPALPGIFPGAEVIPTGGALYLVGLSGMLQVFKTEDDRALLQTLLLLDEAIGQAGETLYAVVLATRT